MSSANPWADYQIRVMNFIHRYQPTASWVSEINRFIDRNLAVPACSTGSNHAFHESDTSWTLRLDLPGFSKQDVKITVTGRVLHIVAECGQNNPFGSKYERSWKLGDGIDVSAIRARLEDGLLELVLPKLNPPDPQPSAIEIQ